MQQAQSAWMMLSRLCLASALVFLSVTGLAQAQPAAKIDVRQDGDSYRIRVEAVMPAFAQDVGTALTDCDRARAFVPHLDVLSMRTALSLPATLVTGFFGMNTKGLPFGEDELGSWWAFAVAGVAALATYIILRRALRPRNNP